MMIPSWYPKPGAPLLGTFYKEQAEALAAKGIEVAVAHVSVGSGMVHLSGIRRKVINGVLTYTYTQPNFTPGWEKGRRIQRIRMLEALYRRIEKEWGRPDVVNLRSSLQGYEALALCRKHGLPLFFMEHSSYALTEKPDSPALERLRAVMGYASVNACVSSALQEVMNPIAETRIIPDPVDGEVFYPKEVRTDPDVFVFRAMGQLRPIKGYDTLIEAFALFKKNTDRPVRLEIAGTGGFRKQLQSKIDSLEIGDCCTLVGAIPRGEAPDFMNGCDCFVCSSRMEALSCVLNEAAACGKPVISTSCGGPLDIVTDETGLLVPVDDAKAMASAMRTMLETARNYDGQKIREITLERFGRDMVADLLVNACRDAAQTQSPPPQSMGKTKKGLISNLFFETLKIGAVTIGGGFAMIPLLADCYSSKHNWLTKDEMTDVLAVAQSLPGPIALNASVISGYRAGGVAGGIAAGLGMVLPPLIIMSLIATGYTWFRTNPYVAAAFHGIQACVCGLLAWATVTLGKNAIKKGRGIWTTAVFGAALVLSLLTRLHALFFIGGGLLAGFIFQALLASDKPYDKRVD